MSVCVQCGAGLVGDEALCSYHASAYGSDWAVANRIQCDFFHRGVEMPRIPEQERADDFWV